MFLPCLARIMVLSFLLYRKGRELLHGRMILHMCVRVAEDPALSIGTFASWRT